MTSPKQRSNIDVTITSQTAWRPETTRSSIANANSDRLQIKTVKLTGNTRGQDHIQSQSNNSGQAWRHVYSNTPGFSQGTESLRQLRRRRRRRDGLFDCGKARLFPELPRSVHVPAHCQTVSIHGLFITVSILIRLYTRFLATTVDVLYKNVLRSVKTTINTEKNLTITDVFKAAADNVADLHRKYFRGGS